jgi:hypothetical protein
MDSCFYAEGGNHSQVAFVPWVMNVLSGLGKVHVHDFFPKAGKDGHCCQGSLGNQATNGQRKYLAGRLDKGIG